MQRDPNEIRALLLEQHRRLRELLGIAERLAARFRTGEACEVALGEALAELRTTFVEHNVAEEAVLEPLLARDRRMGAARVARMFEEHTAEHALLREHLTGTTAEVAGRIAEIGEEIVAHIEAEERTVLNPKVLCEEALVGG